MSYDTQRSRRAKRGNRANKILNILIGVVIVLIIITIAFIFVDGGDPAEDKASETTSVETDVSDENDAAEDEDLEIEEDAAAEEQDENGGSSESSEEEQQQEGTADEGTDDSESVTIPDEGQAVEQPSDDPIVEKTITNPSWQPIGTSQTGPHVSSYDKTSVDWAEKLEALSYATGLSQDNMIVWFLGNGGSPHKSIGTVSSNDREEKYRVYLKWIDGEGWKPEKMDVLTELEGVE